MALKKFNFEELTKERRKAVAQSIRTINHDELKKLGNDIFPYADDPWRDAFFRFITENRGSAIHYATTTDGVHLLYCRDQDKGIWFLPGSGKGPLQTRGRQLMKELIEGGR